MMFIQVQIALDGLQILMLIEKEYTICFAVWHCLSFPTFILSNFIKGIEQSPIQSAQILIVCG